MLRRFQGGALLTALACLTLTACDRDAATTADGTAETDKNQIAYTFGTPVTDSTIVAIVTSEFGTDTLRAGVFQQQVGLILAQNPMLQADTARARELRRSLAEGFVLQHVIEGEIGRANDLAVDTALVAQQIAQLKVGPDGQPMTDAQFEQQLAAEGFTMDSVRTILGKQLRQEALARRWAEEAPKPTVAEIETYRKEQAEEVRAQHIVFANRPGPAAQRDSMERVAKAVLDSARRPNADFAGLARRHSDDGTAATGGDLNFFNRAAPMDQTFLKATFALKDSGDVTSDLVRSQFGLHVIRLTGRREGTPMDTLQARQRMLGERGQDAIRARLKTLVGQRKVVVRVNTTLLQADLNRPLDTD